MFGGEAPLGGFLHEAPLWGGAPLNINKDGVLPHMKPSSDFARFTELDKDVPELDLSMKLCKLRDMSVVPLGSIGAIGDVIGRRSTIISFLDKPAEVNPPRAGWTTTHERVPSTRWSLDRLSDTVDGFGVVICRGVMSKKGSIVWRRRHFEVLEDHGKMQITWRRNAKDKTLRGSGTVLSVQCDSALPLTFRLRMVVHAKGPRVKMVTCKDEHDFARWAKAFFV